MDPCKEMLSGEKKKKEHLIQHEMVPLQRYSCKFISINSDVKILYNDQNKYNYT